MSRSKCHPEFLRFLGGDIKPTDKPCRFRAYAAETRHIVACAYDLRFEMFGDVPSIYNKTLANAMKTCWDCIGLLTNLLLIEIKQQHAQINFCCCTVHHRKKRNSMETKGTASNPNFTLWLSLVNLWFTSKAIHRISGATWTRISSAWCPE